VPTIEDPVRHLGYLQQCLAGDKKPLGLFLGAGCPMSVANSEANGPLIPDVAGITKMVHDGLASSEKCKDILKRVQGHFHEDGHENPTVEDMLTHIRALRAVAGKAEVRGLSAGALEILDQSICGFIQKVVDVSLPSAKTPYHHVASWVDGIGREKPVEIFTSNYDLLMEQALEDCGVPYFDGFAGSRKPRFDLRAMEEDELPARWARLWKLHGSINWYQMTHGGVFRGTTTEEDAPRRVIHPSYLKYQEGRRLPYLAMVDRLRAFLKQPTVALVVCGYSFRDEHINEVILQGLQSTQTAIAFGLLYGKLSDYPAAVALATGRANLSLLALDGAVVSTREARWPEKNKEAVSETIGTGVRWRLCDPANEKGNRIAEFTLGDFALLGHFLRDLAGTARLSSEVP
jgi:SIR2-like domain